MKKIILGLMSLVFVFVLASAASAAPVLNTFTQIELDTNWEADRFFPTGGATSVTAFDRDDVARISIDASQTQSGTFQRTEGIKTIGVQNFGTVMSADLYLDSDWDNKAVRAGLWVVGDDGVGARDNFFGILEFVNLEPSTSGVSATGNHKGWRIWSSLTGWINVEADFTYGEWVNLKIELNTEDNLYHYSVDGIEVGTAPAGEYFIREVFLNNYNYGLDTFPNLSNDSYSAHWHVGEEFVPTLVITAPEANEVVSGGVDFAATLDNDGVESALAWAVRAGTCDPNDTFTVAGNVGGFSNPYDWADGQFNATVDMTALPEGEYCFIMNPTDLDLRTTQVFTLEAVEPIDNIAPSVPQNLRLINPVLSCGAVTNSSSIVAAWDASTDNVGVLGYKYWVTTPNRDANNAWITTVNGTSRLGAFNEGEGAYTFKVSAFDAASNYSDWSNTCTFVYDATPPVVTIVSPTNGSKLSGTVDVRATIQDDNLSHYNVAIYDAGVDVNNFSLRLIEKQTSTSEFEDEIIWSFDSTLLPDGDYQIRLAARDLAGNRDLTNPNTGGDSSVHVIQITVNNTPPESEEPTGPTTKDHCMKSGWKDFGFKNQGQCVRFVETGKDSR